MKPPLLILALASTTLFAEPGDPWIRPALPIVPEGMPTEPTSNSIDPVQAARLVVFRDLVPHLTPSRPIFSRVGSPVPMPDFGPVQFANNERRLPFTIQTVKGRRLEILQGYVRLRDHAIFLRDEKTGKHHPASTDPRFAPPQVKEPAPSEPPLG